MIVQKDKTIKNNIIYTTDSFQICFYLSCKNYWSWCMWSFTSVSF